LIKYFAIENFRSIRDESIIEFDLNIDKSSPFVANPTVGFAGANASGKSNVLQALAFTLWFMQFSFFQIEEGEEIPVQSFHGLDESPTKLHIIFSNKIKVDDEIKPVDFEYKLNLTKEKVLNEELHYFPYGRKRIVYIRNGNEIKYGNSIKKIETQDLRENCSVISFAAQFASQEIAVNCKNYGFHSNLNYGGLKEEKFNPSTIAELLKNKEISSKIQDFLKIADVGIEELYVEEIGEKERDKLLKMLQKMSDIEREKIINKEIFNKIKEMLKDPNKKVIVQNIFFKHKIQGNLVDFTPDLESAGTLQFLTILHHILFALINGTVLILDEIELKLHQNLVAYIIGLFQNRWENENGAQLIFSFHNSYLMEILEPHQLWFAEKNDEGCTELFSVADFEDIKKLVKRNSIEELYRVGRFGAIPRGI